MVSSSNVFTAFVPIDVRHRRNECRNFMSFGVSIFFVSSNIEVSKIYFFPIRYISIIGIFLSYTNKNFTHEERPSNKLGRVKLSLEKTKRCAILKWHWCEIWKIFFYRVSVANRIIIPYNYEVERIVTKN